MDSAQETMVAIAKTISPLVDAFAESGHSLYLVGGSVRDAFLGRLGHDLDFTTDARPNVVSRILKDVCPAVWDTGIAFGTVSAEYEGHQIEITTFRADHYDGNSRNPQVDFGDSLEGDLVRRDFTINAMACELKPGEKPVFHDPLGGFADLINRVIDTPASPEQSFGDDPLRMLRAARFVSQLNFTVASRVVQAMTAMAGEIKRITVERIAQELDKLMLGANPARGIDLIVDTGIADHIFPEIPALKLEPDEHLKHKDVYAHSLQVLRQAIAQEEDGPDLVLRWAALIHDIGKPDTRAPKPGGGVTFHHHEVIGARLARRRLRALKYPKAVINAVNDLVFLHMRFHGYGEADWTDSAVRRYVTDAGPQLARLHKLVRADVTTRNKRKAARLARTYDDLERRIAELKVKEDLDKVRPALDGNRIMELLGTGPGPLVGRAWSFLKDLRLERGPMSEEEATAALLEWFTNQPESKQS